MTLKYIQETIPKATTESTTNPTPAQVPPESSDVMPPKLSTENDANDVISGNGNPQYDFNPTLVKFVRKAHPFSTNMKKTITIITQEQKDWDEEKREDKKYDLSHTMWEVYKEMAKDIKAFEKDRIIVAGRARKFSTKELKGPDLVFENNSGCHNHGATCVVHYQDVVQKVIDEANALIKRGQDDIRKEQEKRKAHRDALLDTPLSPRY
ncbi:hypothetical protein K491DRAFT_755345 [Lophiostoma macrostomum CBS 122681]|uniref:Uncharacterized protein n=1 Tax=Lophiostoma macrostomum CBS 122681 TaxID=1314788 RepID=A0A6A6TLY5_9PLEO|nr:hypothetical protein K491DRAFT_755345 [Lophiostoma macrostomum CBS 122681]